MEQYGGYSVNFPAMAKRTFDRLKEQKEFLSITKRVMKRLRKIWEPSKRAKYVHKEVDMALAQLFENPVVAEHVTCKKGCNACCHTQVSATGDEAELLIERIMDGLDVDLKRLAKQSQAGNLASKWYQLPYEDRRCIFLNDDGACKAYNDRPSVCRTNNVFSDPTLCETRNGQEQSIRILNTEKADMAMMGGYMASDNNGALPHLLWTHLEIRLKLKSSKKPFEPEV